MKKMLVLIFMITMLIVAVFDISALAEANGTCGDNLSWTLNSTGILTISGYGEMYNYDYSYKIPPWNDYLDNIYKIKISNGVTKIGTYAFWNCTNLISVIIPEGVTQIAYGTFSGCTNLTRVTIPESIIQISGYAFYNCTNLTDITIPDNVESIGGYAFSRCTNLTNINIPDSVETIGNYAFSSCTELTNINIPDSVTNIYSAAFSGCKKLERVDITDICAWCNINFVDNPANPLYNGGGLYLNGNLITDLVIPNNITNIGKYSFNGCNKLTSVTFGYGVESIPNRAFQSCDNLKYICLSIELLNVEEYAFYDCPIEMIFYEGNQLQWENISISYSGNAKFNNAKKVYNSKKKAYKFETNFETKLDDVVAYAVFTEPTLNNSKATFKGWYDNVELCGDPVNFPYYSNVETLYAAWIEEHMINSITIKDMQGNKLSSIPTETFLATVSFTNASSSSNAIVVLAQYTNGGEFNGLMYVQTEDVPTGSTIKLSIPVDNTNGSVGKLKAFCWDSFGSLKPMGKSASFPVE